MQGVRFLCMCLLGVLARVFQNILENTCKNGSAKPLFMRVSGGKGRNGGRPIQGIVTVLQLQQPA